MPTVLNEEKRKKYNGNRKKKRIEASEKGYCSNCYREPVAVGRATCHSCIDIKKKLYDSRKERSLCILCGAEIHEKIKCLSCRKKATDIIKKTKLLTITMYGGKCECCGEADIRFLTIDHIYGDGNKHRLKIFGSKKYGTGCRMYKWLQKNNYPKDFRVLCWNCNCARQFNNGVCPHKEIK